MIRKLKICLNMLDAVGTCLNSRQLSNAVGTAVLGKKQERSEFGGISRFVGSVGHVGREIGTVENKSIKYQVQSTKYGQVPDIGHRSFDIKHSDHDH